jgi:predicted small metal-binding protein
VARGGRCVGHVAAVVDPGAPAAVEDAGGRDDAWADIAEDLARYEGPDGFVGDCEPVDAAGTRESSPMAKIVNCECGYVARAGSEDEVVGLIQDHMRTDHPDLVGKVSRDELLGWIQEDERDLPRHPTGIPVGCRGSA